MPTAIPAAHPGGLDRADPAAVDLGVTFFDTAEVYGPFANEEIVGEALEPVRNQVKIATKFGFAFAENGVEPGGLCSRPDSIRRAVDNSLGRLRTDRIDLYYQHRVDPEVPIEDVAGTVKELVDAGRCCTSGCRRRRRHGASRPRRISGRRGAERVLDVVARPRADSSVLSELGIGLVPYSPLGKGFLTGTIDANTTFADSDFRGNTPRFQGEALRANLALVDVLTRSPRRPALRLRSSRWPGCFASNRGSCPSRDQAHRAAGRERGCGGGRAERGAARRAARSRRPDPDHRARYPEAQDLMTNREAPPPSA